MFCKFGHQLQTRICHTRIRKTRQFRKHFRFRNDCAHFLNFVSIASGQNVYVNQEPELLGLISKIVTGQDCQVGIISDDWAKMSLAVRLTETLYEASIPARVGNKLQETKEKTCFLNIVFAISKSFIDGLQFAEKVPIYVLYMKAYILFK